MMRSVHQENKDDVSVTTSQAPSHLDISRHIAEFIHFPYQGFKPGERIESKTFELCSELWSIWLCPGGIKPELRDYVGIFLAYKGSGTVRAWFAIDIVDPSGGRLEVFVDEEEGSIFESTDDHWGKSDAIYRRELKRRCPDGRFMVEVNMRLIWSGEEERDEFEARFGSDEEHSEARFGEEEEEEEEPPDDYLEEDEDEYASEGLEGSEHSRARPAEGPGGAGPHAPDGARSRGATTSERQTDRNFEEQRSDGLWSDELVSLTGSERRPSPRAAPAPASRRAPASPAPAEEANGEALRRAIAAASAARGRDEDDATTTRAGESVAGGEEEDSAPSISSAVIPPSTMREELELLLESAIGADVTFLVGEMEEPVHAHKAMLIARCPLPLISAENMHLREIRVPDFRPEDFRELLFFIYTDQCHPEVLPRVADELLIAASRFGLQRCIVA